METDSRAYPDNSLQVFSYTPETQRYGGDTLIAHSLDFFTLSSIQVLLSVEKYGSLSWGRQLTEAFRLLVRQAWGFAESLEEFLRLFHFRLASWRAEEEPAIRQGDREFDSRPEVFAGLFRSEIEDLASRLHTGIGSATDPLLIAEGSLRLAAEIQHADDATRRRIGFSHMHMTANRLALERNDEIYLCRLISRSAQWLAAEEVVRWRELTRMLGRTRRSGLRDLLPSVLAEFSNTLSALEYTSKLADSIPRENYPSKKEVGRA